MVKNPYDITLKSTKRNIFTVLLVIAIIVAGIILTNNKGFDNTYILSRGGSEYVTVDGPSKEVQLYVINFVFSLCTIIVALAVILIRRDALGIISGLLLFVFTFFILSVGNKITTNGVRGVENENLTLTTMLVDRINELKDGN